MEADAADSTRKPTFWRLWLALGLLVAGFGLAAAGWLTGHEHLFHLGLALGPAALVAMTFEYLVRLGMEAKSLQAQGSLAKDTLARLGVIAKDLRESSSFGLERGRLGLVGVYKNRGDAVRFALVDLIAAETQGIFIVASTCYGLRAEWTEGSKRGGVTTEELLRKVADRKQKGCEIRILATHPDVVFERYRQEIDARQAARSTITDELRAATDLLVKLGLRDNLKFYKGSPTCFAMAFIGQGRLFINPYPYECEAYKSWAIMVERREGGIYDDFLQGHMENPWKNPVMAIPLCPEIIDAFGKAQKSEEEMKRTVEDEKRRKGQEMDEGLRHELKTLPPCSAD